MNRRFLAAICLAAIYSAKRFSVREIAMSVRMLFTSAFARNGHASRDIVAKRLRACRNCPLFFKPLRTCGSPVASDPSLGCWCYMPKKATLTHATCWIKTNTDLENVGWTE